MSNSSILKKILLLFVGAVFIVSCDKDFNAIGSDLVGDDHFDFDRDSLYSVSAFSQKTGPVETTKLPVNPLGVFNNGKFGKTIANFVTQLELSEEAPEFREVPFERLESVILKIPYFSTFKETNSDGENIYELDSLYGSSTNKINLGIYENGYYMRDFDPATNFSAQKYFSDQDAMFDAVKRGTDADGNSVAGGTRLNDDTSTSQNSQFVFSPSQIMLKNIAGEDSIAEAPQMRINLNKEFFYKKIIGTSASNLANNNVFKNHFKGLYFKVEEISGNAMKMLDFSKGTIVMTYRDERIIFVDGVATPSGTVKKTLTLKLTGNSASLINHVSTSESQDYENATGNDKLYLKGNQGSVAFVDLLGGGNSEELEALRQQAITNNWLINEANLVFYVDRPSMLSTVDPNRIYLYDAQNNRPLVDYYFDQSVNSAKPKYAKIIHNGIVQLTGSSGDSDRKGKQYKIRVTEHLKNLIFNDSTNVRLGLVVTESIANVANLGVKNQTPQLKKVPTSSVMNPLGTILYGSTPLVPEGKRLRLEISFTKPN